MDREKQSILAVIARDLFGHGPADDLDDRMIWSMAGDVHVAALWRSQPRQTVNGAVDCCGYLSHSCLLICVMPTP